MWRVCIDPPAPECSQSLTSLIQLNPFCILFLLIQLFLNLWRSPIPPVEQGKSDSQRSTFRCSNGGSDSNGGRSQSDDGESEGDDEESRCGSPNDASPRSGEAHGKELQNQLADPNVPTMYDDHVSRPPHLELAGHSIACASNPCQDPYYAG